MESSKQLFFYASILFLLAIVKGFGPLFYGRTFDFLSFLGIILVTLIMLAWGFLRHKNENH